ncbi:MAG: GGDEF domain-containing protein [Lachnospiraceae bacterium]|nr:GGDEF domain-containing protein [Lachnospiraceae bacterium]
MKNRIAVCTNGWSPDVLAKAMEGFEEYADSRDLDIFVFMSFASYSVHKHTMQGELNVYNLCEMSDYDGVVVFSNIINSDETAKKICTSARDKGIPVVSIGMEFDGVISLCVDNESGMRELVTHLVEKHGVKKVFYIGGTETHVDSVDRLRITREVLAEHGLELPDEHVAYGKWSNKRTVDALESLLQSDSELPDAIVCANDIMALAIATELDKRGIRVPEDVIVTGFDNTENAGIFYPAITTVEQDYYYVAQKACELIYNGIEDDGSVNIKVPTRAVIAESCGCKSVEYANRRRLFCKHSFQRDSDNSLLEQNERNMRSVMSDASDYRELRERLREHYLENHQFEGSAFYLVFNSDYLEKVKADEREICADTLSGELEVLVAVRDGKLLDVDRVDARDLIPGYQKKKGERHVFYILPLHYYQYNYGYIVFTDKPYVLRDSMMYPYLEKFQQSVRLLRANLRLQDLYDKDALTGVYNRMGYENKALPLYKKSIDSKTPMTVMFIDINNMKFINDRYGHDEGDNAIRIVAASISDRLEKDWIEVRYGGDEFLAIVPECDEKFASKVKEDIEKNLQQRCEKRELPYVLTASIGYVTTDPKGGAEASLEEYVKEADKLMYKIKKEMHKKYKHS